MQTVKYLMNKVASGLVGVLLALKTSLNKINQVYWNDTLLTIPSLIRHGGEQTTRRDLVLKL